jgi:hypothetical protein
MARKYYILRDGERIYHDTLQGISRLAQKTANYIGEGVKVHYEDTRTGRVGASHRVENVPLKVARNPVKRKRVMKRNPIDFGSAIPEYYYGAQRGHAQAAITSRARKPKRLAAHGRRGWLGAPKAAAGSRKPFKVVAVKGGKSQTFKTMTLAEAKEIAEAMADNGFKATVSTND